MELVIKVIITYDGSKFNTYHSYKSLKFAGAIQRKICLFMDKIRLVEAGNELGLGGTEYVLQLFSKYLNKEHFDVTVIAIHKGGTRVKLIKDLEIPVMILNGNMNQLAEIIKNTDVFHWHASELMDASLLEVLKKHRPKMVIQTNVFGDYEYSPYYDLIDYDLYISKMLLIRRIYEDSLDPKNMPSDFFTSKRKVLSNPVDVDQIISLLPSETEINEFKEFNNLKGHFIIGRIGRADNHKFDLITLDGFAEFLKRESKAKFLLIGATTEMITHATSLGISDQLIIFDTTSDLKKLLLYYRSLDVFVAASNIGESFGMVIAEAMTVGVPVITISTQNKDNGQVELVDNDVTGLVVERDSYQIAEAIFHLVHNKNKRMQLSIASNDKIIREYDAKKIVGSLEQLIFQHLHLNTVSNYNSLIKNYSLELFNDYQARCSNLWSTNF